MSDGPEQVFGMEEIRAWRAWRLIGDVDFVRLASVSHDPATNGADGVWPTNRWFIARCLANEEHRAEGFVGVPVETCSCGLYAAKSLAQLEKMGYPYYGEIPDKAVGEVAFAGKVIEGSQGWKAEKARIARLWIPHRLWRYAEPLARTYGVPVGFANFEAWDGTGHAGRGIRLDEEMVT